MGDNIAWDRQPVTLGVDQHLQRGHAYIQGCESVCEALGDVAALLQGMGGEDAEHQLQQLHAAVQELLTARHSAQLHAAALQELKGTYQASGEVTPFAEQLSERAEALGQRQPYSVQQDALYRDYLLMATGDEAEAEAADERVDDDIEIEGGPQLAPNAKCPITAKPILELVEPVQDAMGVVYEKSAVVGFFRTLNPRAGGRAIIVAGSTHEVTLAELVPAQKVIRAKKIAERRRRFGGAGAGAGGGGGTADEDVLDV
ncbi:hypothetical protein COHA_006471 [Chlorella ohadii]|uniref:SP-RING-type domain-containing protein n=1 Tax=Chlorella ohadii TaxID=2649997 RepID=A0AAD5H531_9CHLO|nr:hypothetical protein COHA_006471 [Chlorella ohadii]